MFSYYNLHLLLCKLCSKDYIKNKDKQNVSGLHHYILLIYVGLLPIFQSYKTSIIESDIHSHFNLLWRGRAKLNDFHSYIYE